MRCASIMPPAQPRCAGCNKLGLRLAYPLGDRYRCWTCHDAKAVWQGCSLGWCTNKNQAARCVPLPALAGRDPSTAAQAAVGKLACPACVWAHECTTLSRLPGCHALEETGHPAEAMSAVHLMAGLLVWVEVWILPRGSRCILYWVRIVLWRCWGVFAGVLRGHRRTDAASAGNPRRIIAEHVSALKAAGDWPPGHAPVVVLGAEDRDLPRRVRGLRPEEHARLKGFAETLSRQRNTRGMNWELLNLNPVAAAQANGKLIKTAAEFLASIGRTPDTARSRPWNADTAAERAFRRSLHTSTAALFKLRP